MDEPDPEAKSPNAPGESAWELLPSASDAAVLREQVRAAYLKFGEKVRDVLGRDVVLVETPHFLIWTDWRFKERAPLAARFEEMYAALASEFGVDPASDLFLAKCPAFCFQRPGRFRRFAQKFDGYNGKNSAGYTRSVAANGHVHLVLVRQGDSPIDMDRFATTLVHEGTHAFAHRLYSPRLIPHWVNEGLADLMAERVLGDRSPTAENAALLAKHYSAMDRPIADFLTSTGPIAIQQYALAHSVVAFLDGQRRKQFAAFVRSLKDGLSTEEALAANYDGMTIEELERRWREEIRTR